ncbi:MAG: RHS repeat-associated core domain-containing protein [Bacteroidota bacterium]
MLFTWKPPTTPPANAVYELEIQVEAGNTVDTVPGILTLGAGSSPGGPVYQFSYTDGMLALGTTYQWRMRACTSACSSGNEQGPWSELRSFTTALEAPTLLGLTDDLTGVRTEWTQPTPPASGLAPFFAWATDPDADFYRLQIAAEQASGEFDFGNAIVDLTLSQDQALGIPWTSQPELFDWLSNAGHFDATTVGDPNRTDAAGTLPGLALPGGTTLCWRVRAEQVPASGQDEAPGQWSAEWVFETVDAPVARRYYLKDHLGSTRAVVNEAGTVTEYYDYYPFGLQMPGRTMSASTPTRQQFTGHERDAETGLSYAGARYLDPVAGQWTSTDPMAADYAGWSPYNYALDSPVTFVDLTGRCPEHKRDAQGDIVYCLDPDGTIVIEADRPETEWSGLYRFRDNAEGSSTETVYFDLSRAGASDLLYDELRGRPEVACAMIGGNFSQAAQRLAFQACVADGADTFHEQFLTYGALLFGTVGFMPLGGSIANGALASTGFRGLGLSAFDVIGFGATVTSSARELASQQSAKLGPWVGITLTVGTSVGRLRTLKTLRNTRALNKTDQMLLRDYS